MFTSQRKKKRRKRGKKKPVLQSSKADMPTAKGPPLARKSNVILAGPVDVIGTITSGGRAHAESMT